MEKGVLNMSENFETTIIVNKKTQAKQTTIILDKMPTKSDKEWGVSVINKELVNDTDEIRDDINIKYCCCCCSVGGGGSSSLSVEEPIEL